jgi:hypothetical protein
MRGILNAVMAALGYEPIGMPHAVKLIVTSTDESDVTYTLTRQVVHLTDGADLHVVVKPSDLKKSA